MSHHPRVNIQTNLSYPNQTSEQSTFDAVYNIQQIQTADQTINYSQDKTGLITAKNSTNYSYDDIGRLTQAGADSFSYDNAGNNQNDNALYNILNNQLKTSDIYTIIYDSMGNIKTKYNKLTQHISIYIFNQRNQLTSYIKQDENNQTTKTLTYAYDAFNRRVSKTENTVEQRYLYDGYDIVALLDNANQVIATITHDESIDTALSITNNNGTFYYHRDHQGSIIALTDSGGTVVESFTYDGHYGTITNHTVTTETNNPYAYTGRELDTTELYYYRARYYDATVQRFIGEDPIGFISGDINWYRYVKNSPVNFVDPTGLANTVIIGPSILIKPEEGDSRMSNGTFEDIDGYCAADGWYKLGPLGTCYIFSETGVVICWDPGLLVPDSFYNLINKYPPGQKGNNYSSWGDCNEETCP